MTKKSLSLGIALNLAIAGSAVGDTNPTPEGLELENEEGSFYLITTTGPFRSAMSLYGSSGLLSDAFTYKTISDCFNGAVERQKTSDYILEGVCTNLYWHPDANITIPLKCDVFYNFVTCSFYTPKSLRY